MTNLGYGDNVPLSITSKIDPAGDEIMADRRYNFSLKADATTALLLNDTMGRDRSVSGNGPVVAGQTVNLSYTEQQMHGWCSRLRSPAEQIPS